MSIRVSQSESSRTSYYAYLPFFDEMNEHSH